MTINCDVAEGIGNEAALFPYIDWVNIACGAHAGDETIIFETMQLAKQYNIQVGLHPSYPDKENFGRVVMSLSDEALKASLFEQINLGVTIAKQAYVTIQHIKPHGVLYNQLALDEKLSHLFLDVIESFNQPWTIVGLSESVFVSIAKERGFIIANEVFADRRYTKDKYLVPRSNSLALIANEEEMLAQAKKFLLNEHILSIEGRLISLQADTICLHGDGANVEALAKALHQLIKYEK